MGVPVHPWNTQANNPIPKPNKVEMPAIPPATQSSGNPTPKPEQVEIPPQYELMELDIPDNMPDLIDILEEVLLDFDAWAHSVLDYEW